MVLVDSSVFVEAQRRPDSQVASELLSLLASGEAIVTGSVTMEYIRGARSVEDLEFLADRLASIDYIETDRQAWVIAGRLSNRLIRSGVRLANMDVVIAATAIRHDVPLYTLDGGFARIPELDLYEPPSEGTDDQ